VLGTVNNVSGLLIDANDPGDRLGVQNIHHRVAAINGAGSPRQGTARDGGQCGPFCQPNNLTSAEADARDISRVVNVGVKPHADAICRGLAALGVVTQISGC
jgi:hypothetical protein